MSHLNGVEFVSVAVDAGDGLLPELLELVDEGLDHGLGTVGLVVLPRLAQRALDDVPVVVVERHVVLQHVRSKLTKKRTIIIINISMHACILKLCH